WAADASRSSSPLAGPRSISSLEGCAALGLPESLVADELSAVLAGGAPNSTSEDSSRTRTCDPPESEGDDGRTGREPRSTAEASTAGDGSSSSAAAAASSSISPGALPVMSASLSCFAIIVGDGEWLATFPALPVRAMSVSDVLCGSPAGTAGIISVGDLLPSCVALLPRAAELSEVPAAAPQCGQAGSSAGYSCLQASQYFAMVQLPCLSSHR